MASPTPAAISSSSWASLFSQSQQTTANLHFHSDLKGKTSAIIPESILAKEGDRWKHSLVGYVMGKRPYFVWFQSILKRIWKSAGPFELYSLADGFFLFKFSLQEDCERILQNSWTIGGRPLILRKWHPGMRPSREILKSVPIWIRFHDLPIQYFGDDSLSIITSMLGIPLSIDKATSIRSQLSFARVYVEIDFNFTFPPMLTILKEDGSSFDQNIEYEWKPAICQSCRCFDHVATTCPHRPDCQPIIRNDTEPRQQHMSPQQTAETLPEDTCRAPVLPIPPHIAPSSLPQLASPPPSPAPFTELLNAAMAGNSTLIQVIPPAQSLKIRHGGNKSGQETVAPSSTLASGHDDWVRVAPKAKRSDRLIKAKELAKTKGKMPDSSS